MHVSLSQPQPSSSSSVQTPGREDKGLPDHLMFIFPRPFSQEPQLIQKVTRSQIQEGMALEYSSSAPPDCSPPTLSMHTTLRSGEEAVVNRGTLDGRPVVAKLYEVGCFASLLRELDAYECLRSLRSIPKCLGVFAPSHRAWAALLLEDKGDSVGEWEGLSLDERWALYEAATDIHAAGVIHCDLQGNNVVRDSRGRLYIIDFGYSYLDHCCEPQTCDELLSLLRRLALTRDDDEDGRESPPCLR
ncbi:hypothetical protein GGX14DRAFT_678686 [Mycena pura]|uniref:Protein kinase domain-containing protein n=1 Tax=Mycena pura TaxID=153505 RepID=A0AAD6UU41_9AGAR|nr:hypothetical protein GGX14DRAFT_678686 [Mycena pura]